MNYVLVCLLKGDAAQYHKKMARDISERFNVSCVSDKIDPHITLKYPLQLEDRERIREFGALLRKFSGENTKSKIELRGFDHFDNDVVFMAVQPSKEASETFSRLTYGLKTLSWLEWGKFDGDNAHFHSTLAYRDINDKFPQIWEYLKQQPKPEFEISLDNLTILCKNDKEKWRIYERFELR